ncbi:DUF92 domain-containing protein [Natronosalvus caseinilyticus]|uniref:DUF92 domain-containing protein n=1 Tax=Natronosalvus caseinilyticus TaxID=2953747 RepID=UPI0028ACCB77|nr:DUF92 domain-containing protein [Natronosalvus caseinilyticus]
MTTPVRRAGAFAALCTLSLAVPILGPELSAPIALVLALVAVAVTDGPVFDLFAFPDDYAEGRLFGLLTFVLAVTTLGLLAVNWSLPLSIFVGVVFLVGYGSLAETLARTRTDADILQTIAFGAVGSIAAIAGQLGARLATDAPLESAFPVVVFLAVSGTFLAALLRDVLISYDDPIVLLTVGLSLWLLYELEPSVGVVGIFVAIAITMAIGYVSYALGAASIAGMLTGILLALLTIVLGDYGWFAVLITFFGVGSVSTRFRYDQKTDRGVAEENDGARGSSNVIGNTAAALVAVVGFAASEADLLAVDPDLFLFAFAGSIATALSDTLSSEIGSVFDSPRLITTLEPVEPGTDGGVTWQGELAGVVGATAVAGVSYVAYPVVGLTGALVIGVAGFLGMTADSVLGATLEGDLLGNQSVNFLATVAGALAGAVLYVVV